MKKDEAILKINESDNDDFEVFTTDEHTTYLENFKKQTVDSEVAQNVSEIHKRYDDDAFEMFGKRKASDQKTYNFIKEEVQSLKEQSKSSEPLKLKITELEAAIKNNTGDEMLKKELQTVRDEYSKEKGVWEDKEKSYNTNLDTYKLETELDKAMIGLKFKEDLPQDIKDVFIGKVKADLVKSARFVDSKMIFIDSEGKTLVNKDNALNPFTASEMMSKGLESILSKAEVQNGLKKPLKTEIKDGKEVIVLDNPNATSREEVTKYLIESGIPRSSKDYGMYYKEFTKDLPALK